MPLSHLPILDLPRRVTPHVPWCRSSSLTDWYRLELTRRELPVLARDGFREDGSASLSLSDSGPTDRIGCGTCQPEVIEINVHAPTKPQHMLIFLTSGSILPRTEQHSRKSPTRFKAPSCIAANGKNMLHACSSAFFFF